jgi:hypothetical protein
MNAVLQPKRIMPLADSRLLNNLHSSDSVRSPYPTVVKLEVEKYRAVLKVGISSMKKWNTAQIQISIKCAEKTARTNNDKDRSLHRISVSIPIARNAVKIMSRLTPWTRTVTTTRADPMVS